jgi:hypothetical protein
MAEFKAEKVDVRVTGGNAVIGVFFKASLEGDHARFVKDVLGEAVFFSVTQVREDLPFGLFSLDIDSHGIKHKSSSAVAPEAVERLAGRLLGVELMKSEGSDDIQTEDG